jgi:hypothetical protein
MCPRTSLDETADLYLIEEPPPTLGFFRQFDLGHMREIAPRAAAG